MTRKERRFKGVANASEQSLPLCRSTMCGKVVGPRLQLECGEGLPQRTSALSPKTKVVVATTVMLSFISFWRAAAIVLSDLASSAYYAGGIAETAIGKLKHKQLRCCTSFFAIWTRQRPNLHL